MVRFCTRQREGSSVKSPALGGSDRSTVPNVGAVATQNRISYPFKAQGEALVQRSLKFLCRNGWNRL
ncbi:MAG: hypothetical protein CMJ80_08940 [Planctomycetaceae bacterium]|nr:hypothetical protein [Planctomycetaceae bacterium]